MADRGIIDRDSADLRGKAVYQMPDGATFLDATCRFDQRFTLVDELKSSIMRPTETVAYLMVVHLPEARIGVVLAWFRKCLIGPCLNHRHSEKYGEF